MEILKVEIVKPVPLCTQFHEEGHTLKGCSVHFSSLRLLSIVGYISGGQNGLRSTADFEWRVNGAYFSHTGGAAYAWSNVANGMNVGNWPTLESGDVVELDTTADVLIEWEPEINGLSNQIESISCTGQFSYTRP